LVSIFLLIVPYIVGEPVKIAVQPNKVFCAKAREAHYGRYPDFCIPELPRWADVTTALLCLRSLWVQAGLDMAKHGSPDWNPLGEIIHKGDKVVLKPNWVHHYNQSGQGVDCLVTHTSVVEAILHYVDKAEPGTIVLCDAPIQSCDFDALMMSCGVHDMIERFRTKGVKVEVKDLRRTIRRSEKLSDQTVEGCRPIEDYIVFDLGYDSALEPITTNQSEFRVTMYNPDSLNRTHAPGKHQYLVAREAIDADVVINVPKLKTHRKAGITGALKNVVGINGQKEYLPHHRKGGSESQGDCYPGRSRVKEFIEEALDATNRAEKVIARQALASAVFTGMAVAKLLGEDNNYDGSWHGNDTVWRMTLDLQRVLHYGQADGTLSDHVQRTIVTITDAIIAGQGEGPLSPIPIGFGMLTLGTNTAALEWVHARLMGLDPERLALTREAFRPHRYPLTDFSSDRIIVYVDGEQVLADEVFTHHGRRFRLPRGWQGYDEPADRMIIDDQRKVL
jgi:uncharacterized protein (DUF362 family)